MLHPAPIPRFRLLPWLLAAAMLTACSRNDPLAGIGRAAQSGNPAAQFEYAQTLFEQPGRERDAADWLLRSAHAGHADAQHELGLSYLDGRGVAKDPKAGIAWLERAALNGADGAANDLAWVLATHREPRLRDGARAVAIMEPRVRDRIFVDAAEFDTLAAAYARVGRYPEATRTQARAIAMTARDTDDDPEELAPMKQRMERYARRKSWSE
ncbi:MAG: hypothetical protein AB7Q97_00660 [Gammaproteobacteria bacterium]